MTPPKLGIRSATVPAPVRGGLPEVIVGPANLGGQLINLLGTGGYQVKKVAYLLVIIASIVWLSVEVRHGLSSSWCTAYAMLLGAVTTGYLGGKKIAAGQVTK